jgi:ABC-type glycerol-3-phosphate transport system permease component
MANFTTSHSTNYPEPLAALTIATAPIVMVYLIAQRQFISRQRAGAPNG